MENKLPEGWEWKKLGDLIELKYGKGLKKENRNLSGKFPVYGSNGVVDYHNEAIVSEPCLIVGRKGSIGAVNLSITPCWPIDTTYYVIPPKELDLTFLFYLLPRLNLENLNKSTAIPGLNRNDVYSKFVPIPPLKTQQKIVSILEKAEETKKLRAQADELTQKFLQSVFLEMFGDPMTNPKNWEEIKLKEISEIVSGVTKGRKLDGKSTVFVPYLRVANVQDGYLDLAEIKDIEVLPSDVEKYALQSGDILLTEGGDPDKLGRGAVWNGQIPNCIHQNHIFRVRVNTEFLVPEYLSMLISSAYGKMYFLKSAKQTTGIASINSTQLKNFPALIAPLDLQLKFAEIVHQIEKTTESQKQSSFEINTFFDALMQKAFTGELVS